MHSSKKITLDNFFDRIFYINLDGDVTRNQNILDQFQKYGITNFERVSGVKFLEIPEKSYWRNFNLNALNEKYILGSMGCRASHKKIMDIAMERNYQKILIFEDDIFFTEDPNIILNNNKHNLNNWDMLYFGGTIEEHFNGQIVGGYAYGLNRKLIEEIYYMLPTSGMEVDNFYAKIIYHMSYNYNLTGKYLIKKLEPFNTVKVDFNFNSNIR
jgi:GR25 family glycosyltransferase involved in LPS biosynthesis